MILEQSSLSYLRRNLLQSIFVVLGIALGIAVTFAIDIAIESSQKSFALSAQRITGVASHSINSKNSAADIDEEVFRFLKNDLGLKDLAPVLEAFVPVYKNKVLEKDISLTQKAQDRDLVKVLGVDPLSELKFRKFNLSFDSDQSFFASDLSSPGFYCTKLTADNLNIKPGDEIDVRIAAELRKIKLLSYIDSESSGYDNLFLMDISQAQELLNKQGFLSKIDLKINDKDLFETYSIESYSVNDLKAKLQKFSPALDLISAKAKSKSLQQMTKSFNVNLQALSFLAIVVAAFLIYNSVSFSVVRRRKLYAIFRTIGVSKKELIKLVLLEAAIFSVLGIALGLILGYFFANALVELVLQTINDIYFSLELSQKSVSIVSFFKSVVLGLVTSLLAAFFPAYDASSTKPSLAMSRSGFETTNDSRMKKVLFFSLFLALLAYLLYFVKIPGFVSENLFLASFINDINLGFLILLFALLSFSFLLPSLISFFTFVLKPIYNFFFSFSGNFALESITKQLSRTAIAIAALTIALSMALALSITVSSFRKTVESWLNDSLQADVYISVPRLVSNQATEFLPDTLQSEIVEKFSADLKEVLSYSTIKVKADLGTIQLAAVEEKQAAYDLMKFKKREPGFWQKMSKGEDLVIISEPFAYKQSIKLGDELNLETQYGKKAYKVAAIFEDFGSEHGIVMLAKNNYQKNFAIDGANSLGLFLKDKSKENLGEFLRKFKKNFYEKYLLFIRSNIQLKEESLAIFDRTFKVTGVLKFIALFVAFIAILSSFMALQLERVREFSILRASGLGPWQVMQVLGLQTLTMGLFAFVLAIPAGILQAYIMIFVINKRSFGWSLSWNFEYGFLWEIFILALAASLISVLYPIYFTNNLKLSESLRND